MSGAPELRLLVLRALLSSEPFCFWNLKIAFFDEWAYAAWRAMERDAPVPLFEEGRATGRRLPKEYPGIACDFAWMGTETLVDPSGARDAYPPLFFADTQSAYQKESSTRKRAARKAQQKPGVWPETPLLVRDAQRLGLTYGDLQDAPRFPQPLPGAPTPASLTTYDQNAQALENALIERRTGAPLPEARHAMLTQPADCGLCKKPIATDDVTSYSFCPSADWHEDTVTGCHDLFHLECLAQHFQDAQPTARTYCLPVAGACPHGDASPTPWAEIVRRIFRRKDLLH